MEKKSVATSAPAVVLLVDDDPSILKILEVVFSRGGYETLSAENGEQAMRIMERRLPDLVITDIMMPAMDGFELCGRVRSDTRWQLVPFIFLSARGATDDRIAGLDLGADDYVVKPFDRRELLAKARTLINRHRIYRTQLTTASTRATSDLAARESGERPPFVLVVDDDEPMRKLIEFKMRNAGFRVATASDGERALSAVRQQPPDLIISDVLMPVMDGLQLRQEIMQRAQYATIPFLFLTARDDPEAVMAGLRLGVDDYLTKPINPQVLVQKARNLVEHHRARGARFREEIEQAARRVTDHLEPDRPRIAGLSFAHRCEPLEVRGGDYYDYIVLDNGCIVLVVGDVMGKKWGAWFFSVAYIAYLRSVIRSTTVAETSPGAIVKRVNELLWDDLKVSEVFTTLAVALIDPKKRTVITASAGHPPPLHYRAASERVMTCGETGTILGIQRDEHYPEATVVYESGDTFVFYSDGITEARNGDNILYGSDRFVTAIHRFGSRPAEEIVSGLFGALDTFVDDTPYDDDRTIIVVRAG